MVLVAAHQPRLVYVPCDVSTDMLGALVALLGLRRVMIA